MTRHFSSAAIVAFLVLCAFSAADAQQSGITPPTAGSGATEFGSGGFQTPSLDGAPMINADDRFLRDNRDPGQIVGGAVQGVGNTRGQAAGNTGANGRVNNAGQFGGGRGGFNQFNQMNPMFGNGSMNNQRQQLRVPVRLGFKPTNVVLPPQVGARVQQRLTRIPRLNGPGLLTVEMEGRVAVLKGQVASEDARSLAGRLVMLEPGVSDVRNELQVASAAATP